MDSAYRGEVDVSIGGEALTLVFDWAALSAVKTELGSEDLGALLAGGDLTVLAKLTAAGLQRHHPEWTAARVFEASPPVAPLVQRVTTAFNYAWMGPGGEDRPENPLQRMASFATRLRSLLASPKASALRHPNSGP